MSDLQCPARILLVRHGEATYTDPEVQTDDGGWLTDQGREQALTVAQHLRQERVAAVVTSPLTRAAQTGQIIAEELGLPWRTAAGLQEFSIGSLAGQRHSMDALRVVLAWIGGDLAARCPDAEDGHAVLARMRAALDELADAYRGESVVVVSHGGVIGTAVANLVAGGAEQVAGSLLPNCAVVALDVDGDGYRLARPWPGQPAPWLNEL